MPPDRKYEKYFQKQGFELIAGVDEVGVGPLAGPVLAAAVILPSDQRIKGLNDSKKLSARQRAGLFTLILKQARGIGVGIVDHRLIDRINILKASHLAMRLAVEALKPAPDLLLIDGKYPLKKNLPQLALRGGDGRCSSIAAASIVAKVLRDRIMGEFDKHFPRYGFGQHKGYGTPAHLKRILKYGPCPIHRRSYNPVQRSAESHKRLDIQQLSLYNSN